MEDRAKLCAIGQAIFDHVVRLQWTVADIKMVIASHVSVCSQCHREHAKTLAAKGGD